MSESDTRELSGDNSKKSAEIYAEAKMIMKVTLRKQLKSVINKLSQEELIAQSQRALAMLVMLPEYTRAERIGVFMNLPCGELKTMPIIRRLFEDGKQVFLPRCTDIGGASLAERRYSEQRARLEFFRISSYSEADSLEPLGPYGIREPKATEEGLLAPRVGRGSGLDLLLVPGLAFSLVSTPQGGIARLGRGKGFYDDFVLRHCEIFGGAPFLLGMGLEQQLVEQVPCDQYDQLLNALILGDKYYRGTKTK